MREQLSVEEYIDELLGLVAVDERSESVAVADSRGRVLAQEVVSTASIPVFDKSAMDGFAVRWSDIATAPTRLRIVGDAPAGSDADPDAAPGECARIMTGAALPTFADTVVPVEQTQDEGPEVVVLEAPVRKGAPGRLVAVPAHAGGSGSHLVTTLVAADGYAMVTEETTAVHVGDLLSVRWL